MGGATRGLFDAVEPIHLVDFPWFAARAAQQDSSLPVVPQPVWKRWGSVYCSTAYKDIFRWLITTRPTTAFRDRWLCREGELVYWRVNKGCSLIWTNSLTWAVLRLYWQTAVQMIENTLYRYSWDSLHHHMSYFSVPILGKKVSVKLNFT